MLLFYRKERTKDHPSTPTNSRRAWDGLVKVWRKKLHCWDDPAHKLEDEDQSSDEE